MIKFQKFHGTGNDFIIFNESDLSIDDYSILAKKVCDRHFGIGADGMIIISESTKADIRMKFYNADGSIASMCGNGIRCFSKFVYENRLVDKKKFTVETLAGIMKPEVIVENNKVTFVKVNLGKAVFLSNEIPRSNNNKYFINEEINVEGTNLEISSLARSNNRSKFSFEPTPYPPATIIGEPFRLFFAFSTWRSITFTT